MTAEYIGRLTTAHPGITEVWLIGSRANDRARPDSDWDYLTFTDDGNLLYSLHLDRQFNEPGIDLLLVVEYSALKPWGEADGHNKKLRLNEDLEWKRISSTEARYSEATKCDAAGRIDAATVLGNRQYNLKVGVEK